MGGLRRVRNLLDVGRAAVLFGEPATGVVGVRAVADGSFCVTARRRTLAVRCAHAVGWFVTDDGRDARDVCIGAAGGPLPCTRPALPAADCSGAVRDIR